MTAGQPGFKDTPHLVGLVALVGRLAQEQVAVALAPLGVTYAQAVTLVRLWWADGHSMLQRELVESLGVSRASGSEVLNQVDQLGLVKRSWDTADARNRVVILTAAGHDLEKPVLEIFDRVERALRDGGSDQDIEAAFAALRGMLANVRGQRADQAAGGNP